MSADLPDDFRPPVTIPSNRDKPYFAPERVPEHEAAVIYQGEYETLSDGTGVAVRAHACALSAAGIPVLLRSFSGQVITDEGAILPRHSTALDPEVERQVGSLEHTSARTYFPVIRHAVIRNADHAKRIVMPQGAIGRTLEEQVSLQQQVYASTIVYSVWEREAIDPGVVKVLSRCAQCWVPSSSNAEILIDSGVPAEKVHVVPHPFDPNDPLLKLRRRRADPTWKRFYSIGRWEPRKGYARLIEAFLREFTPHDNARLTIKYTGGEWPGYPTPEATLATLAARSEVIGNGWTPGGIRERVSLIGGRFPRAAIHELHYRNNLYVSSSHGEAWGLGAFESQLAGNGLVYLPSGGVEDFAPPRSTVILENGFEPVPPSYGWEPGAEWWALRVEDLMSALRRAQPALSHDIPERFQGYSMAAVGAQMRRLVLEVAASRPKIAEAYRIGSAR